MYIELNVATETLLSLQVCINDTKLQKCTENITELEYTTQKSDGIVPYNTYIVRVEARTSVGYGDFAEYTIKTLEAGKFLFLCSPN